MIAPAGLNRLTSLVTAAVTTRVTTQSRTASSTVSFRSARSSRISFQRPAGPSRKSVPRAPATFSITATLRGPRSLTAFAFIRS